MVVIVMSIKDQFENITKNTLQGTRLRNKIKLKLLNPG